MNPSGIRSVLYYMLRLEYLYHREIRLCADPYCGMVLYPRSHEQNVLQRYLF